MAFVDISKFVLESEIEEHLFEMRSIRGFTPILRQYRIPCGIVDLIAAAKCFHDCGCKPGNKRMFKNYLVIELKRGEIDVHALTQVLRYNTYLNSTFRRSKANSKRFIPLLIGASISDELKNVVAHISLRERIESGDYKVYPVAYYDMYRFTLDRGLSLGWINSSWPEYWVETPETDIPF